jgi:hypothetical protein
VSSARAVPNAARVAATATAFTIIDFFMRKLLWG